MYLSHPSTHLSHASMYLSHHPCNSATHPSCKKLCISHCCSVSKRPDRLISKLKTMNIEEVARGGPRIIVVRQPRYSSRYSLFDSGTVLTIFWVANMHRTSQFMQLVWQRSYFMAVLCRHIGFNANPDPCPNAKFLMTDKYFIIF